MAIGADRLQFRNYEEEYKLEAINETPARKQYYISCKYIDYTPQIRQRGQKQSRQGDGIISNTR